MNTGLLCPQKRERVIFIIKIGKKNLFPMPILSKSEYITTSEAIGDLVSLEDDKEFNILELAR